MGYEEMAELVLTLREQLENSARREREVYALLTLWLASSAAGAVANGAPFWVGFYVVLTLTYVYFTWRAHRRLRIWEGKA